MRIPVIVSALALMAAAAHAQSDPPARAVSPMARPLAAFATRRIIVLPTLYFRAGDPMGWTAKIPDAREYLDNLDAELAFALGERGLSQRWVYPPALVASAKRNPPYAPDPYAVTAQWLRPPGPKHMPDQLPDPLASQLRALVAMQEDAQYVLTPLEVRFERTDQTHGRAVLRLVLFDARRERVSWMGDVGSDAYGAFTPALAASLATHVADLVAAP